MDISEICLPPATVPPAASQSVLAYGSKAHRILVAIQQGHNSIDKLVTITKVNANTIRLNLRSLADWLSTSPVFDGTVGSPRHAYAINSAGQAMLSALRIKNDPVDSRFDPLSDTEYKAFCAEKMLTVRDLRQIVRDHGQVSFLALATIWEFGGMTRAELSRRLSITTFKARAILKRLCACRILRMIGRKYDIQERLPCAIHSIYDPASRKQLECFPQAWTVYKATEAKMIHLNRIN